MEWHIVRGALALLLVAGGAATLRTGWVAPWLRPRIHRVALYGRAQLTLAAGLALQSAGGLAGPRGAGTAIEAAGLLTLLAGLVLLVVAQVDRAPG